MDGTVILRSSRSTWVLKLATAFQESFKNEIGRLARHHLKKELEGFRKTSTNQRSEIAALKRQIAALQADFKKLLKEAQNGVKTKPEVVHTARSRRAVTGDELMRKRLALGLTQLEASLILDVSSQTVYKWETGETQPRKKNASRLHEFMTLGKRSAREYLEGITE